MREKYKNLFTFVGTGVFLLVFGILFFFLVFRAGAVISAFRQLCNILMPFIYGMIIAYLLRPICNKYEIYLKKAWVKTLGEESVRPNLILYVSILLSFVTAGVILYVLLSSVIPQLTRSVLRLSYVATTYIEQLENEIKELFRDNDVLQTYFGTSIDGLLNNLQKWIESSLIPELRNMVGNLSDGLLSILNVLSDLLIGIVAAVYILISRRKMSAQCKMVIYSIFREDTAKAIEHEFAYADKMFTGFLGGKIIDSTIIGIICFIGCSILGIPNTLLVSVIVGVTNIIPFFGPYIGLVPSALIIFISSPMKCIWFVIFILLLQQVDGNIIGPRILGNSTGLSGFWVLFSIILFGGMMGFVGMIIGVPLFAVIYDFIKRRIKENLVKKGHEEMFEEYEQKYPHKTEKEKQKKVFLPKKLISVLQPKE